MDRCSLPTIFSCLSAPLFHSKINFRVSSHLSKMASNCEVFCEILIAILLPPLGVCLKKGCCTVEFLICLVLTILGYIPGIIYALYVIVFQNRQGSNELGAPLNSA